MRFKRVEKIVVLNEKETSNHLLVKLKFLQRYNACSNLSILVIMTPLLITLIILVWKGVDYTKYGKYDEAVEPKAKTLDIVLMIAMGIQILNMIVQG